MLVSDSSSVRYSLEAERSHGGDSFRPTVLMERISVRLEKEVEPRSQTWIEENVKGNVPAKRDALATLVAENYVTRERGTRGFEHMSARPYREAEDVIQVDEATPSSARPHPVPDLLSTHARTPSATVPSGDVDGVEGDPVRSTRPHPVRRCPECVMCEHPFDPTRDGAAAATCPACVALRKGLVTPSEAGEMRLLARLSLMGQAA
jgi:hypothetical protein